MKPVLFVTGHAPTYRVGAFARLHEREEIELALFGGRSKHGGEVFAGEMPFPHRHVRPRELSALAASGHYRAVVCPTGGRIAPLATWAGTRRARVPLILWSSLWAHPRSVAHALSYLPLRRLYHSANAVVTYGSHVSAYLSTRGAHNIHIAPQAVDNDFWAAPASPRSDEGFAALFVGRAAREKGLPVALEAWAQARLKGSFTVVGDHPSLPKDVVGTGILDPVQLRNFYAACDVLLVPSIVTRQFIEPWGLVVNEAMNQGTAIISSDAVGAAAGGLVRDGRNGLIVAAGDSSALAGALGQLARDRSRCTALGAAGREDVRGYTFSAWADAFVEALEFSVSTTATPGSVTR
jgi:glycosyltransferase involved in cell wall biosynthesis